MDRPAGATLAPWVVMQIRTSVLVILIAWAVLHPAAAWSDEPSPEAKAIATFLDQHAADSDAASLGSFYAARNDAPAWTDPARVAALAAILAHAGDQGLDFALPKVSDADAAAHDVALTRVALAYATALAKGQVPFEQLEQDWAIPAPLFNAAAGLSSALTHDLAAWYASLPPQHQAYQGLVGALAQYRKIAADGGWSTVPPGEPLKLGMTGERVRDARKRLEAEGDLAPLPQGEPQAARPSPVPASPIQPVAAVSSGAPMPPAAMNDPAAIFDAAMESAVRRFQHRYGIAVDGAIGPKTIAAMNVPVRARIEQIELNLERWRALPHDLGTRYMMVNVPAETLYVVDDGNLVITMKVVVGDPDHPTPVVRTAMVAVVFNPTWTIPASIVTKEILPKAKQNRSYLRSNDIVFVPGHGWQQLPGPKNPLGQLKFETPNRFDVYLHDTPSRLAFDRYFRAQSHGCVRLERASELAGFVLRDLAWNEQQIGAAVADGDNARVDLKRPWRVWILYATSFVDEDGMVEFRDDLYGRDARMRDALGAIRAVEREAGL
jgi:L,D-transpeptidase YcbB